jgi:hypothetical protein
MLRLSTNWGSRSLKPGIAVSIAFGGRGSGGFAGA